MLFAVLCLALAAAQDTTNCNCPPRTGLASCEPNQAVVKPGDVCKCAQCIPKQCVACPEPTITCTANNPPRTCDNCSSTDCCPSCKLPPCVTSCPEPTTVCTGTAAPARTCTTCPTCRVPNPCAAVTCVALASTAPFCTAANLPDVNECCPKCRRPIPCTNEQLIACKAKLADTSATALPVCPSLAAFVPDDNCCYACRPPPPIDPCTPTTSANTIANLPTCIPGQDANTVAGQCTVSCKKPGDDCDPANVKDRSTLAACPDASAQAATGCNLNCRVPRPVCDPACADGSVCVLGAATGTGDVGAPRCVKIDRCREFWIAGMDTNADPTDVLGVVVRRHCLATANVDGCKFEEWLLNSLKCTRLPETKTDGGKSFVHVRCCFAPDVTSAAGRRLLTSDDLLQGASSDQGAVGGLTFQATATDTDTSSASALSAFFGFVAVVMHI